MGLVIHELSRRYSSSANSGAIRMALDRVSLEVRDGQVATLLGPNGAGKTTLLKIVATVLRPTSGTVSVFGADVVRDPRAVRERVTLVLGGERGHFPHLTARENLLYWSALIGLSRRESSRRVDSALARVQLQEQRDEQVRNFSRGMKQRLHIARGLLHDARLLLLDEPTNALDPVTAHAFRDLVRNLSAEGRAIVIASHDMAECEALSDSVVLMRSGRVLAIERPARLASLFCVTDALEYADDASHRAREALQAVPGFVGIQPSRRVASCQRAEFKTPDGAAMGLSALWRAGISSGRIVSATLEETYLSIYGSAEGTAS